MSTNRIILIVVGACIIIAAGIYAYAYEKERTLAPTLPISSSTPAAKVAASAVKDGEYTVQIHSILMTPEDTSITFHPVEYFDGPDATSTAEKDVECQKQPIAACAPTLTKGYYVRDADAADFAVPLTAGTQIALRDEPNGTIDMLRTLRRQFDPVFDLEVENGVAVLLTEKSPL